MIVIFFFSHLKKILINMIADTPKNFLKNSTKFSTIITSKKFFFSEKFSLSFLDLLLSLNEEGADFSDTDIRDEVVTMMIGVRSDLQLIKF